MAPSDTDVATAARPPVDRRRRPGGLLLVIVAAAIVAGAGAGWLATRGEDEAAPVAVEDPGVVHVHGLGINPADGALYAATHTGLFRLDDDGGGVERIADRYQDTMGFTVAGPDLFLASGHPDLRDDELRVEGKPPLLGLIESTDAGRTWQVRSLLGDADLHTIVALDDGLVAYDSSGERVLASSDDGRTWETRSEIGLVDLAVDPADTDRVAAIALDGTLQTSRDGGRTWTTQPDAPAGLIVLRWGDRGLWGGGEDGALYVADATTTGWIERRRFDGPVEAIVEDDGAVHVAVESSGIWRSPDRGRTWAQVYDPED